jgi:hypothetical protein
VSVAEIEHVEPDLERAREFLEQAQTFLRDAESARLSLESSVVLYYQACLSAMDAILTHAGRRVTSGTNAHIVRIEEAAALLGSGYAELFERLEFWRRERGEVSYAAVQPAAATVAALQTDTRDVVAAAERYVTQR